MQAENVPIAEKKGDLLLSSIKLYYRKKCEILYLTMLTKICDITRKKKTLHMNYLLNEVNVAIETKSRIINWIVHVL